MTAVHNIENFPICLEPLCVTLTLHKGSIINHFPMYYFKCEI